MSGIKGLVDNMSLMLLQLSYFIIEADDNDDAMELLEHISDTQIKIFNVVNETNIDEE